MHWEEEEFSTATKEMHDKIDEILLEFTKTTGRRVSQLCLKIGYGVEGNVSFKQREVILVDEEESE